jgi:ATP-dependent DNA ligase
LEFAFARRVPAKAEAMYESCLSTDARDPGRRTLRQFKDWVFETKWDGIRLITEKRGSAVKLWSRNGIDVTARYAVLSPALQKIEGSCVLDGELCALDEHGRSRFQLM